jgi:peptide subunit release factor 1 (eRF1)
MSAPQPNEAEKNIEIWKVKKLIKRLEAARGNGTSMISLIIRTSLDPPLLRHSLPLLTCKFSPQGSD